MINLEPTTGGCPEKHVVCEIEMWLNLNGWKHYRIEQQRHMKKGMADFLAGKDGRAIWIEAKRRAGTWTDRLGRVSTLRAGQQRPGQKRFQDYWQGTIPYVTADRWEVVSEAINKMEVLTAYENPTKSKEIG